MRMWLALFAAVQDAGGLGSQTTVPGPLADEVGRWVDLLIAGGERLGLVAAQGDDCLGFIAVTLHHRPWLRPPRSASIGALWVEPWARRQRVGSYLVASTRAKLAKRGIDTFELHALPSPNVSGEFWSGLGFTGLSVLMQTGPRSVPAR
jgi:ribosomal protein S18 acetylase RimI-like enzyme